jgi:chromosome segregation ATPase
MTTKTTVNEKTILRAANALHQDGHKVTQSAVRDKLGGGSFATISPVLKTWRENNDAVEKLLEVEVPEEIANRGTQLLALIWKKATDQAEEGRQEMEDRILRAETQQAEAEADASEAMKEKQFELETAQGQIKELEEFLDRAEHDITALTATAARVDVAEQRLHTAQEHTTKLTNQLEEVTSNLTNSEVRAEKLSGDLQAKASELTKVQSELQKAEAATADANSATLGAKSSAEASAKEVQKLQVENAELKGKADALDAAMKREASSAAKIEKLEGTIDDLRREVKNVNEDLSSARVDLTKERSEHSELKKKTELQKKK